jgi:hypothetical protein
MKKLLTLFLLSFTLIAKAQSVWPNTANGFKDYVEAIRIKDSLVYDKLGQPLDTLVLIGLPGSKVINVFTLSQFRTLLDAAVQDISGIATNATNIANNAAEINTNQSNISINSSNLTSIQSSVTNNTSNIATNTTAIANNKADITTNVANISTNTTAIGNNASNVSTNQTQISTNQSEIANNAANILAATDDIADNVTDIATNKTATGTNLSNITGNQTNITNNASDIATNATSISTNEADILTNKNDLFDNANDISANTTKIDLNTTDISNLDAATVKLTTNQTISGTKTFTANPVGPSPTAPDHLATRQFVLANAGTVTETWTIITNNLMLTDANKGQGLVTYNLSDTVIIDCTINGDSLFTKWKLYNYGNGELTVLAQVCNNLDGSTNNTVTIPAGGLAHIRKTGTQIYVSHGNTF